MVTDNLLFRIKTHNNQNLSDDEFVKEAMDMLMERYPAIQTYQYERESDEAILILIWFSEPVNVKMDE